MGRAVIPLIDVAASNRPAAAAVHAAVEGLLETGDVVHGHAIAEFEDAFAAYTGRGYCVGVASGLDALRLALLAAGIEPGDDVVVPAMTFVATADAAVQAGGRLVLCDVDEHGLLEDPPAARFTIPVDLHGQLARCAAARAVVEDACQAHGAELRGDAVAACFSFYPSKNLGALGDAGAIVTDDLGVANRARALRNHGYDRERVHRASGYTARLDTLQAAVLAAKLPHLDGWNHGRAVAASRYAGLLDGVGDLRLPADASGRSWYVYSVRTADPDGLADHLASCGIQTGRHYAEPIHLLPAYRRLGHGPGDFPNAEAHARESLSLPLWPMIEERQQAHIAGAVRSWFVRCPR